jgi:tRNA dimethylallyltransferase
MHKIIFIVGPTATGKSEIAFTLAKDIKAEIVSCDSMLLYREALIITNKPTPSMRQQIPHHFIDIISVEETYNVFSYYQQATECIRNLYVRGVPVVVCGGTGLYAQALLDGIFHGVSADPLLRQQLTKEADIKGNSFLHAKLKEVDPLAAKKISPNDTKRIVRALEVYYREGVPISYKQKERKGLWGEFPVVMFGITLPREILYERINKRVEVMFEEGAIEEVRRLLEAKLSLTAQKIIGIKEIGAHLCGDLGLEEAQELMKKNTRNFAKRQGTWFRRDKRINWIDAYDKNTHLVSEEIIRQCMKQ